MCHGEWEGLLAFDRSELLVVVKGLDKHDVITPDVLLPECTGLRWPAAGEDHEQEDMPVLIQDLPDDLENILKGGNLYIRWNDGLVTLESRELRDILEVVRTGIPEHVAQGVHDVLLGLWLAVDLVLEIPQNGLGDVGEIHLAKLWYEPGIYCITIGLEGAVPDVRLFAFEPFLGILPEPHGAVFPEFPWIELAVLDAVLDDNFQEFRPVF